MVRCAAIPRIEVRGDVLALGALNGLGYGMLAVGLVLAFRTSRALNLAHGQTGVFAAVVLTVLVRAADLPYWVALPFALGVGAGVGAAVEVLVVRRLAHVPALVTVVATLGVAEFLRGLGGAIAAGALPFSARAPEPPGVPGFDVGVLRVTPSLTLLLVVAPVAVAACTVLLSRTAVGVRVRAASANPVRARLLGIPAGMSKTLAWALAGALSALTAVLLLPAGPGLTDEALSTPLLLPALAAAVLAGMASMPIALLAGIATGMLEAVVRWNATDTSVGDLAVVAVLLGGLAVRHRPWTRRDEGPAWAGLEPWAPLPAAARRVPLVRWAPAAGGAALVGMCAVLPAVLPGEVEVRLASAACLALLALSVWVLSGLAGELSLGQVAFAAVGAFAGVAAVRAGAGPVTGVLLAPAAGAAAAVLVGTLGGRAGPLGVAVATLAVAYAGEISLYERSWAFGERAGAEAPGLTALGALEPSVRYGLAVAGLFAGLGLVHLLARSALGRRLVAARDNPRAARALGLDPASGRADALALSGALAGASGALLVVVVERASPAAFPVQTGIAAVACAVVGGLWTPIGALLGALWIAVLPAVVDLSSAGLAASAFGWLLLLLCVPAGLAAGVAPLRDIAVRALLRAAGQDPARTVPAARGTPARAPATAALDGALRRGTRSLVCADPAELRLEGLAKRFGDVEVLRSVDLAVRPGEIVAVVGPNGAGKTTLLDIASGFTCADGGRVVLGSADLSRARADVRARAGLGRSFQTALLFPTMSLRDAVRVSTDRGAGGRAHSAERADALIGVFGLDGFAEARVRTLSTGVRRLAELACAIGAGPRVLLLDEPASGLAGPEVDALGRLLVRTRDETGVGILLIEHDLALVAATADRTLTLSDGLLLPWMPSRERAHAGAPS